ncbi:uncharacterized protein MONBRDRAFT_6298 [Monosiga brevicollis MX1]|uniref:HPt domain-containing protein n=1 Tax=Monosiga brevicollis TaxID=81824 RepID=A9UTF1_MONBE|nr:uncharacterized protein MONBRDRAFT_6298 [Monosiga brevicollis MX1]EDQ91481.1 predicted protein [Monosiga brevicollis MX1]|eukprot:XP_001743903.1 hypothetical protein [Monosiga brevicollis MX1]
MAGVVMEAALPTARQGVGGFLETSLFAVSRKLWTTTSRSVCNPHPSPVCDQFKMAEAVLAQDPQALVVLDHSVLETLESVPNLYQEAMKVIHEKIAAMQALRSQPTLNGEQMQEFGDLAHGLKSGTCMIGCVRLAHVCNQLGA